MNILSCLGLKHAILGQRCRGTECDELCRHLSSRRPIHNSSFIIHNFSRGGFTLLELLVVIAIMGLLGTASVGGYRAMQRGMEERGVMQNVNQFIRAAYQRAQIDRQPVAVYFWNECIRDDKESATATVVVVGKAVAVRRSGRVTYREGRLIGDEYADLRFNRYLKSDGTEDTSASSGSDSDSSSGVWLYRMNGNESSSVKSSRSLIAKNTVRKDVTDRLLHGQSPYLSNGDAKSLEQLENDSEVKIEVYAYKEIGSGGAQWKIGDAYGFEFAELELPANYIFGTSFSQDTSNPVKGEDLIRFKAVNAGENGTDGKSQIEVCAVRQVSGSLTAKSIGTSENPTKKLN